MFLVVEVRDPDGRYWINRSRDDLKFPALQTSRLASSSKAVALSLRQPGRLFESIFRYRVYVISGALLMDREKSWPFGEV